MTSCVVHVIKHHCRRVASSSSYVNVWPARPPAASANPLRTAGPWQPQSQAGIWRDLSQSTAEARLPVHITTRAPLDDRCVVRGGNDHERTSRVPEDVVCQSDRIQLRGYHISAMQRPDPAAAAAAVAGLLIDICVVTITLTLIVLFWSTAPSNTADTSSANVHVCQPPHDG